MLLGWVEEERLGWLDGVVAGMGVPRLEGGVGQGVMGCAREWVLGVLGRLEMEGVLSNPELLVAQFFRQRSVGPSAERAGLDCQRGRFTDAQFPTGCSA